MKWTEVSVRTARRDILDVMDDIDCSLLLWATVQDAARDPEHAEGSDWWIGDVREDRLLNRGRLV